MSDYISISQAVGKGTPNAEHDVMAVQLMLDHIAKKNWLDDVKQVDITGKWDFSTQHAAAIFQMFYAPDEYPLRKMRPSGSSIKWMNRHSHDATLPKKPEAPSEWEQALSRSSYATSGLLSQPVKDWLKQPPTHAREAGVFQCRKYDEGRRLLFLGWKTMNTNRHCVDHLVDPDGKGDFAVHGWFERETSLEATKRIHKLKTDWISILGNDAGAKGIAAMNAGMNVFMFHYVMKKGMCIRSASGLSKRKLRLEGRDSIELFAAVIGAAGGAKTHGKKLTAQNQAPLHVSELDWKGFVNQLESIRKGTESKPASPGSKRGISPSLVIRTAGGSAVGMVKHFD